MTKRNSRKKPKRHVPTAAEIQRRRRVMSDEEWERREANERVLRLRNAKNTRLTLVRYASSILFFVNLYWASVIVISGFTAAIAVPALNMTGFLVAVLECFQVLHKDTVRLERTPLIAGASVAVDLIVIAVSVLLGKDVFFPFFSSGMIGIALVCACAAAKLAIIRRAMRLRRHRDAEYERNLELISE